MKEDRSAVYGCFIHGRERTEGVSLPLVDPSTGEVFAHATAAGDNLVDEALSSARESFKTWRATHASARSEALHALADGLRKERESLALTVSMEAGKTLSTAGDEVLSAAALLDYFAEEGLRLAGRIPLMGYHRERVLIVREPVGVVGAITPFNYPLSTIACKLAPALAAGCTLVAKPDEHTPLSTLRMARLALEAGLPPGVFNVVTGTGDGAGRRLVDNPVPRLLTFTGSRDVGKEILATSGRYVRKVILELGGHCPAIVARDAPWKDFLPQIVSQSLKNCGQYCYRISRIYAAREIYDEFLKAFVEAASALRVGPATDPFVDVGPLNNEKILLKVETQVKAASREGARIESGGARPDVPSGGFYYSPTVLTGVTPGMRISQEEVFGPVVLISPFTEIEEAVREANRTPYGLAAYVFTKDLAGALDWADRLEVGSVWVNRIHQAYHEAPFGGMKESGLGREKSPYGIEEFTELKTIYLSY